MEARTRLQAIALRDQEEPVALSMAPHKVVPEEVSVVAAAAAELAWEEVLPMAQGQVLEIRLDCPPHRWTIREGLRVGPLTVPASLVW